MKPERELTVLIIDEHPEVSQMLARGLRRIPGIRVVGETSNVMLAPCGDLSLARPRQPHLPDYRPHKLPSER